MQAHLQCHIGKHVRLKSNLQGTSLQATEDLEMKFE